QMGQAYPQLTQGEAMIAETLLGEEVRFKTTLDRGLRLLDAELERLDEGAALPGETAFKLYDTYGFPLDLTQDALREAGRTVDESGFDAAMEAQKAQARAAWAGSGEAAEESVWFDIAEEHGSTEFLGYDTETAEGQVIALVVDGAPVQTATRGDIAVVLNQTPFYAESGGQVGDSGVITTETAEITVTDTRKKAGVFVHLGRVSSGEIALGSAATLTVEGARRGAIRANHSGTHLLHEALRQRLGDHVAQRGSLNAPDRLRFDFSHGAALSSDDLSTVEREVNTMIRQNTPVETRIMTPDAARDLGAQALFGEKYGDEVRVVSMGRQVSSGKGARGDTYSLELCGGTHVARTGDIGLFVMLGDSASSGGVRRIEALTGQAALDYLRTQDRTLAEMAQMLKTAAGDVTARVAALQEERKALLTEVERLRREVALGTGGPGTGPATETLGDIIFLGQVLDGVSAKDLRGLVDVHKSRLGSGAVLLISDTGGKAALAAGVTDDLTERLSAVALVQRAAEALGGKGGGGRPDMAQGGGPSVDAADAALDAVRAVISAA
ncbi:MAG: alanine--tRNA ligase-related protein, partial [Pseudomonadota bacterium]